MLFHSAQACKIELVERDMENNKMSYVSAVTHESKIDNIVKMSKEDFLKYASKADNLRKAGQYKESVACYLQSIMLERNNYRSYLGLGQSYKYLNDYDKAIKTLEKSAQINPTDYKVFYEMGICYLLKAMPEEAIKCFQKSVMLDRSQLDVQLQLALAHELVDEKDMAMLIYNKLIEEHPEYLKASSHKAALLICDGKYLEASKIFFDILKRNPDFHRAYFGLAVCFDNLKKVSEARRFYSKFLKIKPHSSHADYVKERLNALKPTSSARPEYLSLV